jgi:hypothetical protein
MHLSKSDFLKYQICPSYFWLWKHRRDVVPTDEEETIKRRLEQGNEVEAYARTLFPNGILVEGFGAEAQGTTRQLVAGGTNCIFQATIITPRGLLAMADILVRQDDDSWALYEVKSTNSVKPEHLSDTAFQKIAFEEAGYKISQLIIIHLDKTYVRDGEVKAIDLLMQSDVTAEVEALLPDLNLRIDDAVRALAVSDKPKTCSCRLKTKSGHCPTFHYLNPDIPEYSVFHITRIGNKQLEVLVDDNIFNVEDVPDDIDLTFRQKNQIQTAKTQQPIIDREEIAKKLNTLKFPLYFFDYEAISVAVPLFEGTTPFQQVPFQYSLHILREPDGELEHLEFLARTSDRNPMPELLRNLKAMVGNIGSVIVWYQVFEKGRNTEMAAMYPEYERFLLDMNERISDLRDVFEHQHYVHHGFHGRTSIKKVLPVLIPDLSYKELDIQGGEAAALAWYEAVLNTSEERENNETFDALLKYCCLDTLAMVKIYQHLAEILVRQKLQPSDLE